MTGIIDPTTEEIGNPNRALETVTALINDANTTTTQVTKKEDVYKIPDKFVGKSLEEVLTAYQNLETAFGRAKSELGQSKQSVDQLLQQKRENDLRANGAQVVTPTKAKELTAADLLENPTEALNSYLEQRESATTRELRNQLVQQGAQLAQQQFVSRHPDWQQETNDPDFVNWARQTPYRQGLAARAAQEDLTAADALLSEYKAYKPLLSKASSQSTNLEAARKVGLERSATSGDETKPTGKILRRADAMALRISDPEKYESPAFQNELLKAIAENRYK